MAKLNQDSNEVPADRDDLQQIKGIGPTMAQALNNLGIYHFSDLADFTPESLANLLKATTNAVTSHRIERDNWLGQAQTLARHQKKPKPPTEESPPSSKEQVEDPDRLPPPALTQANDENTFFAESEEKNEARAARPNWRELADFFVSFGYAIGEDGEERLGTRVHYSQVDTSEQWTGIVTTQLLNWMLAQANLPLPPEPEAEIKAEPPAEFAEEIVMLELSDLWVSEVKAPALAKGQQANGMLQAVSRFNLSGAAANKLTANQLPFKVELYLVNIETNRSKLIVTQEGQLIPGELSYEIQQTFALPAIGRYQLYMVAMLLPPGDAATHLQGPIIRVEPT